MSSFHEMYQEFEKTKDVSAFFEKYSENKNSTDLL